MNCNNIDVYKSQERASKTDEIAKRIFKEILIAKYGDRVRIEDSTKDENIYRHIDYHIWIDGKYIKVDIKGSKPFFDNPDIDIMNECIWIELNNVNGGIGSAYGDTDYIVRVFANELWFLDRHKLIDFIGRNIVYNFVDESKDCYYNLYSRYKYGKDDVVTKVPLKHILSEVKPKIIKR